MQNSDEEDDWEDYSDSSDDEGASAKTKNTKTAKKTKLRPGLHALSKRQMMKDLLHHLHHVEHLYEPIEARHFLRALTSLGMPELHAEFSSTDVSDYFTKVHARVDLADGNFLSISGKNWLERAQKDDLIAIHNAFQNAVNNPSFQRNYIGRDWIREVLGLANQILSTRDNNAAKCARCMCTIVRNMV
jgi:hypothetical protein